MMRVVVLLALLGALLTACGGGADAPVEPGVPAAAPYVPRPLAAFAAQCDDGDELNALVRPGDALEVPVDGKTVRLNQVEAASGAKYEGDGVMVWIRGGEAMWQRGGSLTRCREDRSASILLDAADRGVTMWAAGNDPGWILELGRSQLRLIAGGAQRLFPRPRAEKDDGATVYRATAPGQELVVRVTQAPCADTLTNQLFPLTVTLEQAEKVLNGCGAEPGGS